MSDGQVSAEKEDFLYEELLIKGTKPKTPRPMPYWTYDSDQQHYRNIALRYGHEYQLSSHYRELAKNNWVTFDWAGRHTQLRNTYKNRANYYIYAPNHFMGQAFKNAEQKGADKVVYGKDVSPVDPLYVDEVVNLFQNKKTILGTKERVTPGFFMFADELFNKSTRSIPLPSVQSDFWKTANKTVKEKYGFGKYGLPTFRGIPKSNAEKQPFEWIAYLRWQSELAVETMKRISKAAKAAKPDVPFLGTNEYASATPFDWERIGQYVDIQLQQSLPLASGWNRYNPGFVTKFMHDLSQKPVYPYLQVVKYGTSPSNAQVHNWVDQVIRNGGTGIFVGGVEWFDRDLNHPMYAAPEKWEVFTQLVKQVQSLPQVRYPQTSDVALHYSSYTQMAMQGILDQSRFASAYAFLGPLSKTWFTVTNDFQVDRDIRKWDQYKVVVVPEPAYVSVETIDAMRHYAGQGGTLVLSDPNALSWRIDGEDIANAREELLGIVLGENIPQREIKWHGVNLRNANGEGRKVLRLGTNVQVLATFVDGTPAIVKNSVGKGQVITFTFNPHSNDAVESREWKEAWQAFLTSYNVGIDKDIWRFSLPKPSVSPAPQDVCLTGNDVSWYRNQAILTHNKPVSGRYWYDTPPGETPEKNSPDGKVDFSTGKLTNRRELLSVGRNANGLPADAQDRATEKWVVKFGENQTEKNGITFQFDQTVDLTRCRMVISGMLPETRLFLSLDGNNWIPAGKIAQEDAGDDVILRESVLKGNAKYLRIQFDTRPAQTTLTLAEIDIWGNP